MWRRKQEIEDLGAVVVLVSFEEPARISDYLGEAPFGWPILSDPSRAAYRAYGLGSASFARTWLSPRTVFFYARAFLRGQRVRPPRADPTQLGGGFVIDSPGHLRLIARSSEPADRPSVEKLLAAVRAIGRGSAPAR